MAHLHLVLPHQPGDLPHEWRTLRTTTEAVEAVCASVWWWLLVLGETDAPRAPFITVTGIHYGMSEAPLLSDERDIVPDEEWERIHWNPDDCPF